MQRKVFLALGIALCLTAVAQATPAIVVGAHNYVGPQGTVTIDIFVTGGDPEAGVNFNAAIGGGSAAVGGINGPSFVSVDMVGPGTIFQPNHNPQVDLPTGDPQLWQTTFTTSAGTVSASGLLAHVVVDLTGWMGTWALDLTGVPSIGFPGTDFAPNAIDITDGSITITPVPEPSSVVLGLFAAAGLGAVAIRKQRARRAA